MSLRSHWRSAETVRGVLLATLGVTVAGSSLAIGAVHYGALLVFACCSAIALVCARRLAELERAKIPLAVPLILVGLAAWSLFQALPLPLRFLHHIAPANADLWSRALSPVGEETTVGSISLDPGASRLEALRFSMYAAIVFASAALTRKQGPMPLALVVFGSSVLIAFVHLAHGLVGATRVYGFYEPLFPADPSHFGPLLNGNNLAGYLNLGGIVGVGMLLSRRRSASVWLLALGVSLIVAASVRAASRGGAVALVAGLGVLVVVHLVRRRATKSWRDFVLTAGLVGGAVVLGGALVLLSGVDTVLAELGSANVVKLVVQRRSLELLRDFPWVGVGRGAFETAFAPYRPAQAAHVVFTHPENFLLQWATEWGLPVTIAALLALAWFLAIRRGGTLRSTLGVAVVVSVGALLLQNLADLGTEIPAIAIATAVLLGVIVGSQRRDRTRSAPLSSPGRRPLVLGLALVVAFGFAVSPGTQTVAVDRQTLRSAFEELSPERSKAFGAQLRGAIRRHPADPYFYILGGGAALAGGEGDPLRWVRLALERGPREGRAHLLLATILVRRGANRQALLHYRLAAEHEAALSKSAMTSAARLVQTPDDVKAIAGSDSSSSNLLAQLAVALVAEGRTELAVLADDIALERGATTPSPRARRAERMLAARQRMRRGEPPTQADLDFAAECTISEAQEACDRHLDEDITALESAAPPLGLQLRVTKLRSENRGADALTLLEGACGKMADASGCLGLRLEVAASMSARQPVDDAQRDFVANECSTSELCAAAWDRVSAVRAARGDAQAAIAAAGKAARESPNEARWSRLADLATNAGMHAKAVEALEALSRLPGGANPEIEAKLRDARGRASGH